MSTPEQKIAALETELAEYEGLTLEHRLVPSTAALITATRQTLNR
jgi:hypothetical protein